MKQLLKLNSENITALIFCIVCFIYPFTTTAYHVDNFTYYFIIIIFMFSLYFMWGFTGIFSFGQAAFFGIGGYTYGIISKAFPDSSAATLLGLFVGILFAFLLAMILGAFIFYGHISPDFIGIITFCLSLIFQTFMTQTSGPQWSILGVALGGSNGMQGIPALMIYDYKIKNYSMFYLCFAIAFLFYIILRIIQKSNIGYALMSVRENTERSALFGYDTVKISNYVFAVGGAIAGMAGALYASWTSSMVPGMVGTNTSLIIVVVIALAGKYSVTGAMILSFIYVWFTRYMASTGNIYSQIIQGLILVLIVLFIPKGISETIYTFFDEIGSKMISKFRRKSK